MSSPMGFLPSFLGGVPKGECNEKPHYADRQRRDASIDDLCF